GFVYTGKALYYNRTYTQVARFHSGVLTRATFTIVLITYYHAAYVSCFVYTLYGRYFTIFTSQLVLHCIGLHVESIDSTYQHVVGDIIEVATVFQPWACHRYMVGSTFTKGFQQKFQSVQVCTFPWFERLQ